MNDEPTNDLEEAADLAFKAMTAYLDLSGVGEVKAMLTIHALNMPEGQQDAVTACHNYENPADMLAELLGQIKGLASALGVSVHVVPVEANQG